MSKQKTYCIRPNSSALFHNNVDYCVGTGRMGLALQSEYLKQLELVQKEIGFKHIRGHGLFSDDMAIYHEYTAEDGTTKIEYNFTYLDLVMDSYLHLGLRPFLELGFMPNQLASGSQTIFYWKGNTTPPKDYQRWCDLVCATLSHLMQRYGVEEVVSWPIEVWNEPNLPGFWEKADMEEYFKLFHLTFRAIKQLDSRFRVGGPAICGVRDELWIRSFMEFCQANDISLDFVTRHHYTTELPTPNGHYGYAELSEAEPGFANLQSTRDIIDSFDRYKGLEIHITEFNTSYIPNCPLHDTNQNAAFIAQQLSRLGDVNESYSYWTFGDIFEEMGVPFTPFHGGFGLVANGCIPKPTFWTFKFFKELQGQCVHKSEDALIVKTKDGTWKGLLWNCSRTRSGQTLDINFLLQDVADTSYCLITKTVDEDTCNPLALWHNMGEPSHLSSSQKQLLVESAQPLLQSKLCTSQNRNLELVFSVKEHGVIYFELNPVTISSDRGYDYQKVMQYT